MMHTKPSYTLMDFYATLLAYYSIDMEDNSPYKSVVDSLQYITITRPDLAFYVKKVCQFMSHPNDVHWGNVKRILKFLKGTMDYGFLLHPLSSF